ncbi:hypothetical protein CAEBREN_22259 [Caenorhabditis brenneri]|uniref:SXP/RAL-2 family protein Ani s 5-like cation-binding domain-containing protein n=1 Tax=Caenorhabditis brenneri TaxID=135651 RepID=G0NHG1_CAEBE|nr:hypothetical protein CAEBREN_22259 [Caenorhabditis brenneri]
MMNKIILVLLVILVDLKPLNTQEEDIGGRLMMMDRHMSRLNLSDIHFEDPGKIVKVDTIMNGYHQNRGSLIKQLKDAVNRTAHEMVNEKPQNVTNWIQKSVDLPLPVYRNISRLKSRMG